MSSTWISYVPLVVMIGSSRNRSCVLRRSATVPELRIPCIPERITKEVEPEHAQEAQRRLDQDRVAEPDRGDDQDRRGDVGKDVADDQPRMPAADRLRRLH